MAEVCSGAGRRLLVLTPAVFAFVAASLDLTISDLKLKLDGIQKESLLQRKANQDLQSVIRQFHHNLHETAQHIQVRPP